MKKLFILIAKISVSILLLIFLFSRIDLRKTFFYIRTVEPLSFTYAAFLFLVVTFLGIIRWNIFLKILKKDLSFKRIFVSHCGGLFFNNFLPSSIGGDIARTLDLSIHTKDSSSILATVLLDRLSGFLGLVLVGLFGFFYGYSAGLLTDLRLLLFMVILGLILIFCFLILFSKRIFNFFQKILIFKFLKEKSKEFHHSCYIFRFQEKAMIKTLLLSVILQAIFSVVSYFIGMSLGIKIDITYYLIFIPIVSTISILPISIGGLGLRDNAAVVLFSALGVAADKIAAMTLIIFAFLFFVGVIGGVIYGIALHNRRLQCNKEDTLLRS